LLRADAWHKAERLIDAHNVIPSVLIAIYLLESGYAVTERKVRYRPRHSSRSRLGYSRLFLLCCQAAWTLFRFRVALMRASKYKVLGGV
jgi:hypothetical protein